MWKLVLILVALFFASASAVASNRTVQHYIPLIPQACGGTMSQFANCELSFQPQRVKVVNMDSSDHVLAFHKHNYVLASPNFTKNFESIVSTGELVDCIQYNATVLCLVENNGTLQLSRFYYNDGLVFPTELGYVPIKGKPKSIFATDTLHTTSVPTLYLLINDTIYAYNATQLNITDVKVVTTLQQQFDTFYWDSNTQTLFIGGFSDNGFATISRLRFNSTTIEIFNTTVTAKFTNLIYDPTSNYLFASFTEGYISKLLIVEPKEHSWEEVKQVYLENTGTVIASALDPNGMLYLAYTNGISQVDTVNLNFEFANIVPGGSLTSIYFYNGLNESKLYATSNNYLYSFTPAALCEHNCYNNGVCSKRACTCTGTYTSLRNFTFTYLGPWCGALPCELDASNEYACGYDPNTVACQQTDIPTTSVIHWWNVKMQNVSITHLAIDNDYYSYVYAVGSMTGNSIFGRIWGKSDMFIARYQPFQGKRAWWRVLAGYGCTAEATGVVVTSSELIVSGIYKGCNTFRLWDGTILPEAPEGQYNSILLALTLNGDILRYRVFEGATITAMDLSQDDLYISGTVYNYNVFGDDRLKRAKASAYWARLPSSFDSVDVVCSFYSETDAVINVKKLRGPLKGHSSVIVAGETNAALLKFDGSEELMLNAPHTSVFVLEYNSRFCGLSNSYNISNTSSDTNIEALAFHRKPRETVPHTEIVVSSSNSFSKWYLVNNTSIFNNDNRDKELSNPRYKGGSYTPRWDTFVFVACEDCKGHTVERNGTNLVVVYHDGLEEFGMAWKLNMSDGLYDGQVLEISGNKMAIAGLYYDGDQMIPQTFLMLCDIGGVSPWRSDSHNEQPPAPINGVCQNYSLLMYGDDCTCPTPPPIQSKNVVCTDGRWATNENVTVKDRLDLIDVWVIKGELVVENAVIVIVGNSTIEVTETVQFNGDVVIAVPPPHGGNGRVPILEAQNVIVNGEITIEVDGETGGLQSCERQKAEAVTREDESTGRTILEVVFYVDSQDCQVATEGTVHWGIPVGIVLGILVLAVVAAIVLIKSPKLRRKIAPFRDRAGGADREHKKDDYDFELE